MVHIENVDQHDWVKEVKEERWENCEKTGQDPKKVWTKEKRNMTKTALKPSQEEECNGREMKIAEESPIALFLFLFSNLRMIFLLSVWHPNIST